MLQNVKYFEKRIKYKYRNYNKYIYYKCYNVNILLKILPLS